MRMGASTIECSWKLVCMGATRTKSGRSGRNTDETWTKADEERRNNGWTTDDNQTKSEPNPDFPDGPSLHKLRTLSPSTVCPQPPNTYLPSQRSRALIGPSGVGQTKSAIATLMGPYNHIDNYVWARAHSCPSQQCGQRVGCVAQTCPQGHASPLQRGAPCSPRGNLT